MTGLLKTMKMFKPKEMEVVEAPDESISDTYPSGSYDSASSP